MGRITRRELLAGGAVAGTTGLAEVVVRPRARFLALGDSYTVGTGVAPADRWVTDLVAALRPEVPVAPPTVVARNGWTTVDLLSAIDDRSPRGAYDLVTLLIGANDAVRGVPLAAFRRRFRELLGRALGLATDARAVVAMTVPDFTRTPAGRQYAPPETAELLDRYNATIRERVGGSAARLVDLVPPSRLVDGRPGLVARDGLHPSAAQHDLWLERILPAARAALS